MPPKVLPRPFFCVPTASAEYKQPPNRRARNVTRGVELLIHLHYLSTVLELKDHNRDYSFFFSIAVIMAQAESFSTPAAENPKLIEDWFGAILPDNELQYKFILFKEKMFTAFD